MRLPWCAAALALLAGPVWPAVTVRVENPTGSVKARVVNTDQSRMVPSSPTRELRPGDVQVVREEDLVVIRVAPEDKAPIDIEVTLAYGVPFQARTKSGSVEIEGMIQHAEVITDSGDLHFAAPWKLTRLSVDAETEPKEFVKPDGVDFERQRWTTAAGVELWALRDKLDALDVTYGRIVAQAGKPAKIVLEEVPVPGDAPVKPHQLALDVLNDILAQQKTTTRKRTRRTPPPPPPAGGENMQTPEVREGMPLFSSSVRLVNLTAAVFDREGRPITGLEPGDFEVIEDGEPQVVTFSGSQEVPFNLVILLDLSGSTRRDREEMKGAAKGFVAIARPGDKVAVYALANNMLVVISPLVKDRDSLGPIIDSLPEATGGSPVYDSLLLTYHQELSALTSDRNAIIAITDGVDNRLFGTGAASKVDIDDLCRAADSMNVLMYPIFLDPYTVAPAPAHVRKAKTNLEKLAAATGGRLFAAQSLRDLDPVYPKVAEELRSVYTVAYYPKNQNFDGGWRNVEVKVKRRGARVRTRSGYYAQ